MQAHDESNCKTLGHLERRVGLIEDAFTRDDLNKPDFHAHRKEHLEKQAADKRMDEIKDDAIKQVAMWALGIVLAVLGAYWGLR